MTTLKIATADRRHEARHQRPAQEGGRSSRVRTTSRTSCSRCSTRSGPRRFLAGARSCSAATGATTTSRRRSSSSAWRGERLRARDGRAGRDLSTPAASCVIRKAPRVRRADPRRATTRAGRTATSASSSTPPTAGRRRSASPTRSTRARRSIAEYADHRHRRRRSRPRRPPARRRDGGRGLRPGRRLPRADALVVRLRRAARLFAWAFGSRSTRCTR